MTFFGRPASTPASKRSHQGDAVSPLFADAAQKQNELFQWLGNKIQEHDQKIQNLVQQVQDLAVRPPSADLPPTSPLGRVFERSGTADHSTFTPKKWEPPSKPATDRGRSQRGSLSNATASSHDAHPPPERRNSRRPSHAPAHSPKAKAKQRSSVASRRSVSTRGSRHRSSEADAGDMVSDAADVESMTRADSREELQSERHVDDVGEDALDAAPAKEDGWLSDDFQPNTVGIGHVDSITERMPEIPTAKEEDLRATTSEFSHVDGAGEDVQTARDVAKEVAEQIRLLEEEREKAAAQKDDKAVAELQQRIVALEEEVIGQHRLLEEERQKAAAHKDDKAVAELEHRIRSVEQEVIDQIRHLEDERQKAAEHKDNKAADELQHRIRALEEAAAHSELKEVHHHHRYSVDTSRFALEEDVNRKMKDFSAKYALEDDMNRRMNDFSDFVAKELERLDGAIIQEMEGRMADLIAGGLNQHVQESVQQSVQQAMQTALRDSLQNSVEESVNDLVQDRFSQVEDRFSQFEQDVQNFVDDKLAGVDAKLESEMSGVHAAVAGMAKPAVSGAFDAPMEVFPSAMARVSLTDPSGRRSSPLMHSADAEVAEVCDTFQGTVGDDHVSAGLDTSNAARNSLTSPPPVVAAHERTAVESPDHADTFVQGQSSVCHGEKIGHQSPEMIADQVRMLRADLGAELARRLPPLEEALAWLKPLRLQMPTLQSDVQSLSSNMSRMAEQVEETLAKRRGTATGGDAFSDVEDDDGAAAGAHAADENASSKRGSAPTLRAQKFSIGTFGNTNSIGRYMSAVAHPVDNSNVDELTKRLEKLEAASKGTNAYADFEQLAAILEDRVKELDSAFRSRSKEVDTKLGLLMSFEEREAAQAQKVYESWNLENQVDVILSLVQQEMKNVRSELDTKMKAMAVGMVTQSQPSFAQIETDLKRSSIATVTSVYTPAPQSPNASSRPGERDSIGTIRERSRSRSNSPSRGLGELEDKVKRLQECYQQCTLRIAGLKSANRHTEQQATHALDQVKKLSTDVEDCSTRSIKNECRLDYLSLHDHSAEPGEKTEKNSTFQSAVDSSRNAQHPRRSSEGPPDHHVRALDRKPSFRSNQLTVRAESSRRLSASGSGHVGHQHSSASPAPRGGRTMSPQVSGHHHHHDHHSDGAMSSHEQEDVNTGRIWRLGKKVNDMDTGVNAEMKKVKEALELVDEKLTLVTGFLPRKLRRMVEKVLLNKQEEAPEDKKGKEKERDGMRRVAFSEKAPDVRTFNADTDTGSVPWQLVGEPDQKWSWCNQPRIEMGRELARYFEQLEHEKEEMETSFTTTLDQLRQEMLLRLENVQYRPAQSSGRIELEQPGGMSGTPAGGAWGSVSGDVADKLNRRLDKVIIPQLSTLEDRVDRLVKDMTEAKKTLDAHHQKKVDRVEFQLIRMRLQVFDKFDPKQVTSQLENLEVDGKHHLHLLDQLAEQCRKVETTAAPRSEMIKARAELATMKSELHKLHNDQKDAATSVFNANRQLSSLVMESKSHLEKQFGKLELEKVQVTDHIVLQEKVAKLESSMRDNRQILSDNAIGGSEVNQVVKRIILNMEDKIMILEKKMDLIIDGRAQEAEQMHKKDGTDQTLEVRQASKVKPQMASVDEAVVESLGNELSTISEAVSQLRQDVNLSKVSMDCIREQGHQASELAQRLNILVEGPDGEAGTMLSLNRVQVMVAAAARSLVAGSKWVTQEMFDMRLADLRKECVGFMRQVQTQIEESGQIAILQPKIHSSGGPKKLPAVFNDKQGIRKAHSEQDDMGFDMLKRQNGAPPGSAPGQLQSLDSVKLKTPLSSRR